MEALELNGFEIEGCKQDVEPSLSAAEGMVGKTEQKRSVLSGHDTTQRPASGWGAFLCAHLGCQSLAMKQCARAS